MSLKSKTITTLCSLVLSTYEAIRRLLKLNTHDDSRIFLTILESGGLWPPKKAKFGQM